MSSKPKILFYDIETLPLQAYVWGCGDQYVRHPQLLPNKDVWGLICITYCYNDNGPVKIIKWTPKGGSKAMIEEFDKLINDADHTIGKNSDRFDVKMLNTHRMLNDLPGNPSWSKYTDDLEKQMRRYFRLPSQSLDYISAQLGLGGKVKMQLSDWIDIDRYVDVLTFGKHLTKKAKERYCQYHFRLPYEETMKQGKKSMDKMCFYGKKDTRDTRALWNKLEKHFEPKFNKGAFNSTPHACKHCGSTNVTHNGTKISGKTKWQTFMCKDCLCYAGRCPLNAKNKRVLS